MLRQESRGGVYAMMRKFLAVLLLLLAASPLTAPFQTWTFTDGSTTSSGQDRNTGIPPESGDVSCVVPTLRTKAGQLHCQLNPLAVAPGVVLSPVSWSASVQASPPPRKFDRHPPLVIALRI
jgi:hypothetical protein